MAHWSVNEDRDNGYHSHTPRRLPSFPAFVYRTETAYATKCVVSLHLLLVSSVLRPSHHAGGVPGQMNTFLNDGSRW